MAEHQPSESSSMSNASAKSSESTVELNIKTRDSQMYSFLVDKNIPVSAFKEKIASEIGVPVGQQRLIFRGKVLKDNLLLSEYHVDNGHTLHLVARQPSQPQSSSSTITGETAVDTGNREDASTGGPRVRVGQVSHSVVLGTFNSGEQGGSTIPDLSRVIGAVLNSFGIVNRNAINGSGGIQPTMQYNTPAQALQGNEAEGRQGTTGDQSQTGNQSLPGQAFPGQSMPQVMQIPVGAAIAIPIPSLNVPIPDSLHTLSEFMNHMELALAQNANQPNQSLDHTGDLPPVNLSFNSMGLPTSEALAVVLRHSQRLLGGPAIDALSRIAGRIEEEGGSADNTVRSQIETESMQVGLAMQHLGALFLELGRTMLTLRMGQSSAESYVNAGPAVYISPSGPNPILVQPFPLQASSLFGGSAAPLNPGASVPGGAGPIQRHVNIHIHTAGVGPRAINGEGMQGNRVNGTVSGQTNALPVQNVNAAAARARAGVLSAVRAEIDSQIRNFLDNNQSENQGSPARPDQSAVSGAGSGKRASLPLPGRVSGTESQVAQSENCTPSNKEDADVPSSSSGKGVDYQSSGEIVQKLINDTKGAPGSSLGAANPEDATSIPLGLGLGGLQPKRRSKQSRLQGTSGDGETSTTPPTNQNQQVRSDGQQVLQSLASLANRRNASTVSSTQLAQAGLGDGTQFDPASVMSQVINSPALDGLLSGVSQQTGVGSPAVLRNMLGQLTQSPAMMNTVSQLAQQIEGPDFGSVFAGLGGDRSGGIDLSRMVQQMMPFVSQAFSGGSAIPQQAPALAREVQPSYNDRPSDQNSQVDFHQVVQRFEHEDRPEEVLRAVVDLVVRSHDYGSSAEGLVNELCSEDGLAREFVEMLRHDISGRVEDEMGSSEKK